MLATSPCFEKKLRACMHHNRRMFTIIHLLPSACWSTDRRGTMVAQSISARVAASYYLLFGLLASQRGICRHRGTPRVRSRLRNRQSFGDLQTALSHTEFARVFRMSHPTFSALLRVVERDLTRDMRMALRSSGGRVEPAIRLALTIRMLAGASYLDMMLVFKLASSTVYDVFHSTIASIKRRIAMPGLSSAHSDLHRLAQAFTTSRQPPNPLYGCVGAVDGICIEIQKPPDNFGPRGFYCRKGMYAIPAQALVDANYRFLYLSAKCAGSTPDGIAWESSSLGIRLRREQLPAGFWIAGDAAYSCRNGIIAPWTAGQLLHDEFGASRDAFNFYHSSLRMHVEQAFGMLVQRFGILWRKLKFSLPVSTLILTVCFRLHNFCIDNGEPSLGTLFRSEERSVSEAAFGRWFRASQQAREYQTALAEQGRRRDLESSDLREGFTRGLREMGLTRPR
jgi:DDE superfamily endonuclease